MTDSELMEHLHARGWRTEAIDVPMIREACKALAAEQNPWRQAVDEALIAHALDCTGPGDDPKEKVKELIEWAVTIATDPRVAEQAVTAEREQGASATGAEPLTYAGLHDTARALRECPSVDMTARMLAGILANHATPTTSTTGKVDASRVRDEALEEAAQKIESVGPKDGALNLVTKGFAKAVRSLIGTPKSAEGEGA